MFDKRSFDTRKNANLTKVTQGSAAATKCSMVSGPPQRNMAGANTPFAILQTTRRFASLTGVFFYCCSQIVVCCHQKAFAAANCRLSMGGGIGEVQVAIRLRLHGRVQHCDIV